ncbi:unnamed protein product [Cylindrotheca closterium]|uniref:Extradiol ring-cleavage dioxygenase class III enzyme subunit B domain-containing protein n=1 Tax=Cylindrotheca closterium TaxID=2856 RepID=A0AAD2CDG4_9STRA|nr:unnamed protein product [Cylindrotheca closterium]
MDNENTMMLTILLTLASVEYARTELVGGILLPHGDFAYDPTFFRPNIDKRVAANRIATASREAGKWLVDIVRPEIIILSTPHGIKLDNDFGIYMNDKGAGFATIGGDVIGNSTYKKEYNVSMDIEMDLELSKDLLSSLNDKNVSGIYSFSEATPIILNWGEIIPLLLLPEGQKPYKHIIWSHPERRYDHATEMVPELLEIGQELANWIESRSERIAVIISGDLSHTHQPDGPYGYSNASSIFDKALERWASQPYLNANALLETAKGLQLKAMSCGFTGYIMWHGMLSAKSISTSVVYANLNVTYYGMMAAAFGFGVGFEPTMSHL